MEAPPPPQPRRLSVSSTTSSPFIPEESNHDNPPSNPPIGIDEPNHQSINVGKSVEGGVDNSVYTSKYNPLTFLPVAISIQFRRVSNVYFLVIGILTILGERTSLFESGVPPSSILATLAIIISVSLIQEGITDYYRHTRDKISNHRPCVVLKRTDDIDSDATIVKDIMDGHDIDVKLVTKLSSRRRPNHMTLMDDSQKKAQVAFVRTRQMDIRAGDIVLVRNQDVIPADIILLGSSGERGSAYVETSQIDGETNLKLRISPTIPLGSVAVSVASGIGGHVLNYEHPKCELILAAVKRVTRFSLLGYPDGASALLNPDNGSLIPDEDSFKAPAVRSSLLRTMSMSILGDRGDAREPKITRDTKFVATLTSELPNASVNTFAGKITLPPVDPASPVVHIPLNADNLLLRGAALRNTEWIIGVACFTGTDTKLIRNSTKTPSKFSRLDGLVNQLVFLILIVLLIIVIILGALYAAEHDKQLDTLFYVGFNMNKTESWPYLPDEIGIPMWELPDTAIQSMFTYVTLLSNFVPLSLYISVEITTLFLMFLIGTDKNMYHKETDTFAAARSPIVSDLGQVEYIFSDKTGTLTQNVMQFRRCSVNGQIFGAPVAKSAPPTNDDEIEPDTGYDSEVEVLVDQDFHPLGGLLTGPLDLKHEVANDSSLESELNRLKNSSGQSAEDPKPLTFNAEMFLRVMSICHTVVVEKETKTSGIGMKTRPDSASDSITKKIWGRLRLNTSESKEKSLMPISESPPASQNSSFFDDSPPQEDSSRDSSFQSENVENAKISSTDSKPSQGAPSGYTYQAESPDEEALVSAASLEFGFQLKSRDSEGLTISCKHPSLLSNKNIARGLKMGTTTAKELASETASPQETEGIANFLGSLQKTLTASAESKPEDVAFNTPGEETWNILAVNKFDSTRKRMSVVVRSPPELGSIHMLLCKGADSAMLDPAVCCGTIDFEKNEDLQLPHISKSDNAGDRESSNMLEIHKHLGAFATEGLRTLVLGIRILSDQECTLWLEKFQMTAAFLVDRDSALAAVAADIEKNIHIVGSTAIEDKLQDGVPEAISNIRKAGIKLWVLTGDKRETATEIGYSSKVLHPAMNVTDIADGSPLKVRALIATEFMRLVKMGKLNSYQKAKLHKQTESTLGSIFKRMGSVYRSSLRACRLFYHKYLRSFCGTCNKAKYESVRQKISDEEAEEVDPHLLRREVRELAEDVIRQYRSSPEGIEEKNSQTGVREVFTKAYSAVNIKRRQSQILDTGLSSYDTSAVSAQLNNVTDEDIFSLQSIAVGESSSYFDTKKLTVLEKLFATDRDVRKGLLVKHLAKEKAADISDDFGHIQHTSGKQVQDGALEDQERALIIEGSALSHFLSDRHFKHMLYAMASCCKSVIACRVSPKQKALLVQLVQGSVTPSPLSLAIGDGANDVGMIQVAHVGVGISGLEGQQAVNSSDFSIAQFRYLEELLLVHGRWNFIRLGKVIHFSFYKNALLSALTIFYSSMSLFSGSRLIETWLGAGFNFFTGLPIIIVGFFDRDLDRAYTIRNPHLYAAGPMNESFSLRVSLRWTALFLLQGAIIFYFSHGIVGGVGGGISSAFRGLMYNKSCPGDGEGGDVTIYGTVIYICLILVLAIKVLFESSSIIHGIWPAFTCRKNVGEGFLNRVAYTWHGILFFSVGLIVVFLYLYQYAFKVGQSFVEFTLVTWHLLHTRSITWMVIILTTTSGVISDVVMKLFSNMFYPTQTQIHREIQWKERQ